MFRPVSSKFNPVVLEEQMLNFWKLRRIFAKSSAHRQGAPEFVFYEGPPSANGKPGVHHALTRAYKDIFPRYKLMRGYHVARRGGWDTHGLPVELGVERQLGFTSKSQIEAYGIERFNELCRASAFEFIQDWERYSDRLGFWVDMQDAYVTYTSEYIESLWWILKSFWDRGLLYQGYKAVPYCPRCGTPLSDHEVVQGYREVVDPSIVVRLPLVDEPRTSLLIWTTTPWTLPGNVAVAAHPEVEYVTIERGTLEGSSERLILARPLIEKVFGNERVRVVDSYKGRKLKGRRYHPLFTFLHPAKPAYYVVLQDYVTMEEGTGLVHTAPAFGAEDLQAAQEFDLPVLMTVAQDGTFVPEVRQWSGKFVKDADPYIIQDLERRGLLFRAGTYPHAYPFCWRCNTPLLYYARNTWFIRTSQYRERLVALNQQINWVPAHIKDGRFGNWLENNIDWALGRERYWGTPLPIWECERCHHQIAIGSVDELSHRTGRDLSRLDLHRPHVDQVTFACPECNKDEAKNAKGRKIRRKSKETGGESVGMMHRVPELIDVWFDSGSMPFAQWHYPFENREVFRSQYPADFICEAVDQTRGWFYSLHAISALLSDSVAYKNVICLGLILDAEGQKMSKSHPNVDDPWQVFNTHGADAFRWYLYTASPPGQDRRFSPELVGAVVREFSLTLWNVYSFFVTYASLDGWVPATPPNEGINRSGLDRWLLSELHNLVREVTDAYERYDVNGATRPVQDFVEMLSKWYLRRSRRRFWKSVPPAGEQDVDKDAAYATLYETLVVVSKLLAPAMPFLAEALYQNLVRSVDSQAPESVHLADWPESDASLIDALLMEDMRVVMKLASLGHAARDKAGIKVRQPLAEAAFSVGRQEEALELEKYSDLLEDELNVKRIRLLGSTGEAVSYSLKPLPRQLGQKHKALFPMVSQAIGDLDPAQAARSLLDGQAVQVVVDGEAIEILPEEVEVRAEARPGLAVASEGVYLVALKTELTPALRREGLAREFIRRVQELRKQAELEIADHIRLYVEATPDLTQAIDAHRDYVMGETLAVEIAQAAPPHDAAIAEAWFDGQWMKMGLRKAD
jgi:isoleucyl-tRNA synthetase